MKMDLMHGGVAQLERSDLGTHLQGPGVAVVHWRERWNLQSHRLDRALEQAVRAYPEVRFGAVDIADDEGLAQEWAVGDEPTLIVYRDGTPFFRGTGELAPGSLEVLMESARSVDRAAARRGVDRHRAGFVLGLHGGAGLPPGPRNTNGNHPGVAASRASGD
jgi:hypothetical protein